MFDSIRPYRHIIGINVIGPFVIVNWLQFKTWMIVRQNICETILGTIAGQIGKCAWLIASNMFQFFKLFAESINMKKSGSNHIQWMFEENGCWRNVPEIRIGRHQAIMVGEILNQNRATCFDNAVWQWHIVVGTWLLGSFATSTATTTHIQHRHNHDEDAN